MHAMGMGGWEGDTETELSLIPRFNQKRVFWYRTDFDSSQTFMRLYLPALMPGPTAHGLAAEFVLSPESRNCHSRPAARHFSRLRVSRAFSSGFCRHDADPVQVFTASEWPPPLPLSRVIRRELLVRDVFDHFASLAFIVFPFHRLCCWPRRQRGMQIGRRMMAGA